MERKNVFVVGPDELNWSKLRSLKDADQYNFHELLAYEESHGAVQYDVEAMLEKARSRLNDFSGSIDAIVSFWDFPVSLMLPILAREFGTVSPPLESVFMCEDKYWSRVKQREVIPDLVPAFARFDPFDDDALEKIDLDFPFWVKPIKSFASHLGFRIASKSDFRKAIEKTRAKIGGFSEPFEYLQQFAQIPDEIRNGGFCIAEQIIGGKQCTLEGYVCNGEVDSHGIIDSYRHPNRVSFTRFEYPSQLPDQVKAKIFSASEKVLRHIGFDNSPFNIEYFYDRKNDKLWLLEMNPRIAQSHSDLFKKVDGASNHRIMVDIALGRKPDWPRREGEFRVGAKLFIRAFERGRVTRVPGREEIERVQEKFPGTFVQSLVHEGMDLADLPYQDSYSYKLAILYMGAENQKQLVHNFEEARRMLDFQIVEEFTE